MKTYLEDLLWELECLSYKYFRNNYPTPLLWQVTRALHRGFSSEIRFYPTPWSRNLWVMRTYADTCWSVKEQRMIPRPIKKKRTFDSKKVEMTVLGMLVTLNGISPEEIKELRKEKVIGDDVDGNIQSRLYARSMAKRNYDKLSLNEALRQRNEYDTIRMDSDDS